MEKPTVYNFQIVTEEGYKDIERESLSRKVRFNKSYSKGFLYDLEFPFNEFRISKKAESLLDDLFKSYGLVELKGKFLQLGIQYQYNFIKKYNTISTEEEKKMLQEFIDAQSELKRLKNILNDDINSTEDIEKIAFTPKSTSQEVVRISNFFALFSITQNLKELLTDEFIESYMTKVEIDKVTHIILKHRFYSEVEKLLSEVDEKIKFIVIFCHIFQIPCVKGVFSNCNLNETTLSSFYNKRYYDAVTKAMSGESK